MGNSHKLLHSSLVPPTIMILWAGIFLILLLIPQLSCSNPADPNDNLQPGRRDYIWSTDTIPVQIASMRDIWGSSPTDIWICGDADNRRESVWHYDGNNFIPSGEYILAPAALWGSAPNDIWLGTIYSQLWHYDGIRWNKHSDLVYPGYTNVKISSIYGISSNNIYATGMADSFDGYRGVILHFDGSEWKFVDIPEIRVNFYRISYDFQTNLYITAASNFDNIGTPEWIYSLKNGKLVEIYSGELLTSIDNVGNDVYIYQVNDYTNEKKIYRYDNNTLALKINLSNTQYAGRTWGRTEKDFFCTNWGTQEDKGGIGHYNGEDLITIFPFYGMIPNALIFEQIVFFIGSYSWTDNTQVIIRGEIIE